MFVAHTHTQKKTLLTCLFVLLLPFNNIQMFSPHRLKKLTAVHLPLLFLNACYADTKMMPPRQLLKVHAGFDARQCLGNSTECEFTAPPNHHHHHPPSLFSFSLIQTNGIINVRQLRLETHQSKTVCLPQQGCRSTSQKVKSLPWGPGAALHLNYASLN